MHTIIRCSIYFNEEITKKKKKKEQEQEEDLALVFKENVSNSTKLLVGAALAEGQSG